MEQTTHPEEMATGGSTYQIMRKTTIVCDRKPHKVTINHLNCGAILDYVCTPTKDSHCYLRARAKNDSNLHLLKGSMNIYMNNYFITKSELLATCPNEDFKLYLGIDTGIKVDFQPIDKTESTQTNLFTFPKRTAKIETVTHTTTIKNLKKNKVTVVLYDQKPFTQNPDQVKIKIEEQKGNNQFVSHDEFSIVSWTIPLEPEKEQTISFKYSIDYPADKILDEREEGSLQWDLPI